MSRPPKSHSNQIAKDILEHFVDIYELEGHFAVIESILCGASHLKTEGDTATRPRVKVGLLFRILQALPTLSTDAVKVFMGPAAGDSTVWGYAAAARVASKGIEAWSRACTLTPAQKVSFRDALGSKVIDDPLDHIAPDPFGSGTYDPLKDIKDTSPRKSMPWARSNGLRALVS